MTIFSQSGLYPALIGALAFGAFYNWLVDIAEHKGYSEGYVSFLVVFGVLVTLLLAMPFIGLEAALVVGCFFIATGLPMILGSVWRHVKSRERGQEHGRHEHNTP